MTDIRRLGQIILARIVAEVPELGGRVFDKAAENTVLPYVTLGAIYGVEDDAECIEADEWVVQIDLWDRASNKLKAADLEIDLLTRTVTRAGKPILLQPREFKLLEYLVRNAGHIVTRTMLLENVWDYHFDPQTNVIDVHISRLRAKIDKGHDEPILQTVRGAGYMIRDK